MKKYPSRKNLRLRNYDYTTNGLYFITICINKKKCLLGRIVNNKMILNEFGKLVQYYYFQIEKIYPNYYCLDCIIMPNHIHFIIQIDTIDKINCSTPLFQVIQCFKRITTNKYIENVKDNNWPRFHKRLWQRNYYEVVILNEDMYLKISNYIENNPYSWEEDKYYC